MAVCEQSRLALDGDGAQVIVLGCTGMAQVAGRVQKELKVPVVEPASAAIQLAETYIRLGLTSSRSAYGLPRGKGGGLCNL